MTEFRSKVTRALGWSGAAKFLGQVISFILGIALARMLSPDAFGLIAMALVFTGLAGLLMDVGLGAALVQGRQLTESHFSSVFWLNACLGAVLALLVYFLSDEISKFYGRPELSDISKILALQFLISSVALVPRQLLVKAMNFQPIATADLLGMIVAGFLAVWMAYQGYGYWALVWQPIISRALATLYIYWACSWRPSMKFSKAAVQELFGFSFYVFATRLVQYAVKQLDKLVVGRYLGASQVGLLDKAQSMMLFPLQNVSNVIGSVMFPALSEIQHDVPRVRKVYLKSIQSIALLTFPMMAGMFAVAENFTVAVLGNHWIELVPILRILCFAGLVYSIVTVTGTIYLSLGKAKLQFKVNLFTRPLAVAGILIGLQWGVQGVAIGTTVAAWINTMITLKIAGRLIDLSLSGMMAVLYQILLASVLMCSSLFVLDQYVTHFSPVLSLTFKIITGVIVYFILVFLMRVPALADFKAILESKMGKYLNN